MKEWHEYSSKKRIFLVLLGFVVLLTALGVRLFWVQLVKGAEYAVLASGNRTVTREIGPERGTIYDRNMNELAISTSAQSLYADPSIVNESGQLDEAVAIIVEDLKMDESGLRKLLETSGNFVYIKRQLEPEASARLESSLKKSEIKGFYFIPESKRYYPYKTLASHVLGICGVDNAGLEGIEFYYDKLIGGTAGEVVIEKDGRGTRLPQATHSYTPPVEGKDVVLTIDSTIQYIVETELDAVFTEQKAQKAVAIVMDPETGEVLAMASRPTFDPNDYASAEDTARRNLAITDVYEPGSTMKVCVAAMALEDGICNSNSHFNCPGFIDIADKTIKCAHSKAHGDQSFAEILENSCNVGFVTLGQKIGLDRFYDYLDLFGFGSQTGIDLPGEERGIIVPRSSATRVDLATMSIGQANACTPMQLISAISVIANEGVMAQPHVLKGSLDENLQLEEKDYRPFDKEVISSATAAQMMSILEGEVARGTGSNAMMEGYRVGGKTGTAEKVGPTGGYLANEYVVSFIGVAPVSKPELVCLVVVDAPQGDPCTGGDIAAPAVKNILQKSFDYLQVPFDKDVDGESSDGGVADLVLVPDLVGMSKDDAVNILEDKNLKAILDGTGSMVWKQSVLEGSRLGTESSVVIYLANADQSRGQTVVPDFTGKSLKKAVTLGESLGLTVVPAGSGLAQSQSPEAGTLVSAGSRIEVLFAAN